MTREEYQREHGQEPNQQPLDQPMPRSSHPYQNDSNQNPWQANQSPYGQPSNNQPPQQKHHHYVRDAIVSLLVIAIAIFGYGAYQNHQSQQASQTPQTAPEAPKSGSSNTDGQHLNHNLSQLRHQMQQLDLSARDQKIALQKFAQVNSAQQREFLHTIQKYQNSIPTKFAKRELAQRYINQLAKQSGSQNQ